MMDARKPTFVTQNNLMISHQTVYVLEYVHLNAKMDGSNATDKFNMMGKFISTVKDKMFATLKLETLMTFGAQTHLLLMAAQKPVHHTKYCAHLKKASLDVWKNKNAKIDHSTTMIIIAQTIPIVPLFAHDTLSIAQEVLMIMVAKIQTSVSQKRETLMVIFAQFIVPRPVISIHNSNARELETQ